MKRNMRRHGKAESASAEALPAGIAASIGRMIARHSYLEWMLASVLYALLSIAVKQGRLAVRIPPPRLYITTVAGVQVFDAKGQYLGTIKAGRQAANVAFGGPGKQTLYLTAREAP